MTRGAGEKDKTMDGFSFEQNSEEIQKYVLFFFPVGAVMHVSMSGDYKMNMHHDILFHKDDLGLMRFAP